MFELLILPFLISIASSAYIKTFSDDSLSLIVEENYNKAQDEFNRKYKDKYGGKYKNFTTRQENLDILKQCILNYEDTRDIEELNIKTYDGEVTPIVIVKDFIYIFSKHIQSDNRLITYRHMRKHDILTKEALDEINNINRVRIRTFVDIIDHQPVNNLKPYTLSKTTNEINLIIENIIKKKIVLVDSFRGFGKSETLLKVALDKNIIDTFDKIIIMRHGVRDIQTALQSEISSDFKYLILIDNVDNCIDEFVQLLNFISASGDDLSLLITSQTFSIENIKRIIIEKGFISQFHNISLNNWSKDDYIELLRNSANGSNSEDEEMIVIKYPSPYLISWIGERKANTQDDIKNLLKEYRELFIYDTYKILKDILSLEQCKKLIFSLCCSIPLNINETYYDLINQSLSLELDIPMILRLLETGGIVRKLGYQFRFYPDLRGDIYLGYCLKNNSYSEILNFWINNSQDITLLNIQQAGYVYNNINIKDIMEPIVDTWFNATGYFQQSQILKKACSISEYIPEKIFNLLYVYFDTAKDQSNEMFSLSSDNFGPIIKMLWRYFSDKKAILNFIRELGYYNMDGTYSNYKVKGLIEFIFSPIQAKSELILSSLEVVEEWIQSDVPYSISFFKYASSEILKGSHEQTKASINEVVFSQGIVEATGVIIQIRRKCISIIKFMLDEKYKYGNVKAIEDICRNLGDSMWATINSEELPINSEIKANREQLVNILGSKLLISDNIPCNIVLERILLWWWVSQCEGITNIDKYLIQFKRNGEYLFVKYYVDSEYRILSFDELAKNAPVEDRSGWFIENAMCNISESTNEDAMKIAIMLNNEINTVNNLNIFLKSSINYIDLMGICWSSPNIIDEWVKINNILFVEYFSSEYYFDTHGIFRAQILSSLINNSFVPSEERIKSLVFDDYSKITNEEVMSLLNLLINKSFSESFVLLILQRIIKEINYNNPSAFIHRLYFIFKERDKRLVTDLLINIINKYKFDNSIIHMIAFILKQFNKEIKLSEKYIILKQLIIVKLKSITKWTHYENSLIGLVLDDIEEVLEFIKARLSNEELFHPVPFKGFTFLDKYLNNVDNLNSFIHLIISLINNKFNKTYLYTPLVNIKDVNGELIIIKLLEKYIIDGYTDGVLEIMRNIEIDINTLSMFVKGLEYLKNNYTTEQALEIIELKMFPIKACWRSIGSDSPSIVNRIDLYKQMYNMLPYGKLKDTTSRCINSLQNELQSDRIRDEIDLNPR